MELPGVDLSLHGTGTGDRRKGWLQEQRAPVPAKPHVGQKSPQYPMDIGDHSYG